MSDPQTDNAVRVLRALARERGCFVTLGYEEPGRPGMASHVSGELERLDRIPPGDGGAPGWLVTLRRAGAPVRLKLSRVEEIRVMGGLREARRRAEG